MVIPPYPAQEAAKLVLGYLAEEHLMTAYDEFLQASPYLDSFSNEYGRVFMTSLKNILAEYMAVKICVETCKPIGLRRKLTQCPNLLEVVKLLITLVDKQKINYQDKPRIYKRNVISKVNSCDECNSLDVLNCTCNSVHSSGKTQVPCDTIETITESSVEATSLADLPGNAVVKEDIPKSVISPVNIQKCDLSLIDSNVNQRICKEVRNNVELNLNNVTSSTQETNVDVRCLSQPPPLVMTKPDVYQSNIKEFDNILNIVTMQSNNSVLPNTRVLNTGTFKESANVCVEGKTEMRVCPSQTAELPDLMRYGQNANCNTNSQGVTKEIISMPPLGIKECTTLYVNEKYPEQKIKILSDIKVDDSYSKMPPILRCTTPTPLVQTKTLYINDTVAYKNNLQTGTNYNYTKDEIMAMPTFILVPSSGSSESPQVMVPKTATNKQHLDTSTTIGNTPRVLKPLSIDVKTNRSVADKDVATKDLSIKAIENINEIGLIKTVDLTTESLPKETATSLNKSSTPSVLPPMKKSSSTPRRTSHIRVLDFTTPRRILNEEIAEKNNNDNTNPPHPHTSCTPNPNITQIPQSNISSKSNVINEINEMIEKTNDENMHNIKNHHKNISSEKKIKPGKNWDADLRANIGTMEYQYQFKKANVSYKRKKPNKKNISPSNTVKKDVKNTKVTNLSKNRTYEKKKSMPKNNSKKFNEKPVEKDLESIKPTINIISLDTSCETPTLENDNNQIKDNNDNEQSDTPEAERQALQNVIGAKLNISELLETPYKQVLYDIQMDTPRCLGPDLPDEPMSDIKIMNIPTPRFFDTPKLTQATPSSYSSRQTDYSSGGSYYKPDDQDYIPIDEVLECAITVAEDSNVKSQDNENNLEEIHERPKRPVRKCAKNVSYRRKSSLNNRVKEDSNLHSASLSTDVKKHFIPDKKANKKVLSKPRKTKSEVSSKGEVSLNNMKVEKIKSPRKEYVPRKSSTKESNEKRNRKLSDSSKHLSSTETQPKKKTIKENTINTTTAIVAAPTKSRRKSATPRKLHCTKSFNSDSSENNSSNLAKSKEELTIDKKVLCHLDSDSEQAPLRWSDDGSQDGKSKETQVPTHPQNEEDDIDNIKKYIENCSKLDGNKDRHDNQIFDSKRSFDAETAKIIERDLLGTPPRVAQSHIKEIENNEFNKIESAANIQSNNSKSDSNCDIKNQSEDTDEDEVELTVSDCNEDSKNYFSLVYDESKFIHNNNITRLKEKYCIELCIEDDISIRLNASALSTMFEQDPGDSIVDENYFKETATAVSSISNIDKLYTPLKNARNQCLEIFDSTLTSLDTPLKNDNSKGTEYETPLTEIVLEIENVQGKDKGDTKKRKRNHQSSVNESLNSSKKAKSETQELLKSANIQNIDIESVLSKLHGP